MKIKELTERLAPKASYLTQLSRVLQKARTVYRSVQASEAKQDKDYDTDLFDSDLWTTSLNFSSLKLSAPFQWNLAGYDQGKSPVSKYLHSAHTNDDGTITVNLFDPDLEDFEYDEFRRVLLRFIEHEAVHMAQRDKMGHDVYTNRVTGFQKAKKFFGNDPNRAMQIYLSDPQEIMAHARDLSNELKQADKPLIALRHISKFADYLPTWQKYIRSGFSPVDPVVKQLMKYTAGYLTESANQKIIAFHGTGKEFERFSDEFAIGTLTWFTNQKSRILKGDVGASSKGFIITALLDIKNPAGWDEYDKYGIDELIGLGYDGLKLEDDGQIVWVTFSDKQIKILDRSRV
jgi:hypothetical protein